MSYNFDNIEDARKKLYEQAGQAYGEIEKKIELLKLIEAENFMTLVNAKRELYYTTPFGFSTFREIVRDSRSWINRVKNKEVRKNAKGDEERGSYIMLVNAINNATGIEVKEITNILSIGYDTHVIDVYFVDKEHGLELILSIPNAYCSMYNPNIYDAKNTIRKGLCGNTLINLELRLKYVAVKEGPFVKLELIRSFPSDTYDISDFKKYLDEFAERLKWDKEAKQ